MQAGSNSAAARRRQNRFLNHERYIMICADSQEFFEISIGPQPENTLKARLLCLGDFLKKCLQFPLALVGKACRSCFRFLGIFLSASLVILTLGSSIKAREMFVERVVSFAKDLADWILLPLALILCFLRLILAFLIHPNFYFNAL